MKLKTIAASVVALTALSSHAASNDWGTHDVLEHAGSFVSGSFGDTFAFSLTGASDVTSSVFTLGSVIGGTYSLWSYGTDGLFGTADDTGVASWTYGAAAVNHTVALDSGSYYYFVGGTTLGGAAAYSLASAAVAAPVPEPETYALLGAGLGIVGFVASRRRRDY